MVEVQFPNDNDVEMNIQREKKEAFFLDVL